MRKALWMGCCLGLALMSVGCTLLDDEEPLSQPGKGTLFMHVSTAAPVLPEVRPLQQGDISELTAAVVKLRLHPDAGHVGIPFAVDGDPLVADFYHYRPAPPMRAPVVIGTGQADVGGYRCVSGVLKVVSVGVQGPIPRPHGRPPAWTCPVPEEHSIVPFGPICFPPRPGEPQLLDVDGNENEVPWVNLAMEVVECPPPDAGGPQPGRVRVLSDVSYFDEYPFATIGK